MESAAARQSAAAQFERLQQIGEVVEQNIESWVQEVIEDVIREGEWIGEGQQGVVLRVDGEQAQKLGEMFDEPHHEDLASKLLKVGADNTIEHEHHVHQRAYNVMEKVRDDTNYARIPMPIGSKRVSVDDEQAKERLRKIHVGDNVEEVQMLAMEFINGHTFGEFLLREVVKTLPKEQKGTYTDQQIDTLNRQQLVPIVQNQLHIEGTNFEAMRKRLQDHNKTIPQKWLTSVDNTLKLLHQSGIYHRDLHEHNIMIGNDEEVYIIDFGAGIADGKTRSEGPYINDAGQKTIQDESILLNYEPLTMTRADRERGKATAYLEKQEKKFGRILPRLEQTAHWQSAAQSPDAQTMNRHLTALFFSTGASGNADLKVFIILKMIEQADPSLRDGVIATFQNDLPVFNKLTKFR